MAIAGWLVPLLWPLLIAAFVGAYGLRRAATLPGQITLAVVCFGLFAMWQVIAATNVVAALQVAGLPTPSPWLSLAAYLAATACAIAAGAAIGWTFHRRMFREPVIRTGRGASGSQVGGATHMSTEQWTVLREHFMSAPYLQVDGASMDMLLAEKRLQEAGIESRFEPLRPDQAFDFRSTSVTLMLMVRESDLAQAQEVVADVWADAE